MKGWCSLRFPNPSAKIIWPLWRIPTLIPGMPFLILASSSTVLKSERGFLEGTEVGAGTCIPIVAVVVVVVVVVVAAVGCYGFYVGVQKKEREGGGLYTLARLRGTSKDREILYRCVSFVVFSTLFVPMASMHASQKNAKCSKTRRCRLHGNGYRSRQCMPRDSL